MITLKGILASSTLVLLSACAALGPKPHVVYHRPDVINPPEKVLIMPVTNFAGKKTPGAKDIEMSVNSAWANLYGADKVLPVGPVVDELNKKMKGTYIKLVKTLDNISMVEQLHKDPELREYIGLITSKLGNFHLGFAIINGGKAAYEKKKDVVLHLGLFDTKNLTWKWITKIQDKKSTFGDWRAATSMMVSSSFDKAKEADLAKEDLTSKN